MNAGSCLLLVAALFASAAASGGKKIKPPDWYDIDSDADFEDLVMDHHNAWLVMFSSKSTPRRTHADIKQRVEDAIHMMEGALCACSAARPSSLAFASRAIRSERSPLRLPFGVAAVANVLVEQVPKIAREFDVRKEDVTREPVCLLFRDTERKAHYVTLADGAGAPDWLVVKHDISQALSRNHLAGNGRYARVDNPYLVHDEL